MIDWEGYIYYIYAYKSIHVCNIINVKRGHELEREQEGYMVTSKRRKEGRNYVIML